MRPGDIVYVDSRAFLVTDTRPAAPRTKAFIMGRFIYARGAASGRTHVLALPTPGTTIEPSLSQEQMRNRSVAPSDRRLAPDFLVETNYAKRSTFDGASRRSRDATPRSDRPYQYRLKQFLDADHVLIKAFNKTVEDKVMTVKQWLSLCTRHGKSG